MPQGLSLVKIHPVELSSSRAATSAQSVVLNFHWTMQAPAINRTPQNASPLAISNAPQPTMTTITAIRRYAGRKTGRLGRETHGVPLMQHPRIRHLSWPL